MLFETVNCGFFAVGLKTALREIWHAEKTSNENVEDPNIQRAVM